jgi:N-acetylmuramate 1-kinase
MRHENMKIEGRWEAMSAHASTKIFSKGSFAERPALLIEFEAGAEEKRRFSFLTQLLGQNNIPVPGILFDPGENEPYIVTEYIDGKLFSKLTHSPEVLEDILDAALAFNGIDAGAFPAGYDQNVLDAQRFRYEMDYFLLHFCESFLNDHADDQVRQSLYALADAAAAAPAAFAHRDYHSENIMVSNNSIFILDYQDALFAPRAYDLASLIVDGYRNLGNYERTMVIQFAAERMNIAVAELRKTALERAVKAMGTFGYQIVHRKKAKYFESMKRTSQYIKELAGEETIDSACAIDYLKSIQAKLT